ncbi:MAG: aspartyl protease family protein [Cyanobacteriota bacterium]|nr:aspartyl protease family protein [Cyanobacteriota bacterium]
MALCLALLGSPVLACARSLAGERGHALIQTRGQPLRPGSLTGEGVVPLERAEGGDTPILPFSTPRGPLRLLLDTGAATSMVTPAAAERLGLRRRPLDPGDFSMAGGGLACQRGRLASAALPVLALPAAGGRGGLRLEGLEVLVSPVAALPPGVDGVLGAPTLRQGPLVVDPRAAMVMLGGSALRWRQTQGAPSLVVPLRWRLGVPLLPLRLGMPGGGSGSGGEALADTGAEGLFLTAPLAERLTPLGPSEPARLVGVCGLQEVKRQRLLGIALGAPGAPLEPVEAIILANPVFALLGVEAIAGQELLRGRRQLWRLDAVPPRLELW